MLRLPMKPHEPAYKKFGAVFTGLIDSLVEEEGVADGAVKNAVEDMGESFALLFA